MVPILSFFDTENTEGIEGNYRRSNSRFFFDTENTEGTENTMLPFLFKPEKEGLAQPAFYGFIVLNGRLPVRADFHQPLGLIG